MTEPQRRSARIRRGRLDAPTQQVTIAEAIQFLGDR